MEKRVLEDDALEREYVRHREKGKQGWLTPIVYIVKNGFYWISQGTSEKRRLQDLKEDWLDEIDI